MTRLIATIAFAVCVAVSAIAGQDLSFVSHQLVAGRAKIAETGYIEKRSFGTARFSPELTIPVELIYDIPTVSLQPQAIERVMSHSHGIASHSSGAAMSSLSTNRTSEAAIPSSLPRAPRTSTTCSVPPLA